MATSIPNVSFPVIQIKLANITLTWKGNAPDYFTSITYNRYVNKANEATLNITYAPGPNDNPNYVEEAIVQSGGDALIQYGYTMSRTRWQRCLIYDYKVTIDNGVLSYTLYLVSRSVSCNWEKMKPFYFKEDTTKEDLIKHIETEIRERIKINNQQAYQFIAQAQDFIIDTEGSAFDYDEENSSPLAALITYAQGLRCVDDPQGGRYYYGIEVDDSGNGIGKVILRKFDINQTAAEYTFNWGTKDSDVISWSIDYKGAVALARARHMQSDSSATIEQVTDKYKTEINPETGKMATFPSGVTDVEEATYTDTLSSIDASKWNSGKFAELADHCYTAKLTVIGQTKPLSIGLSVIQVNPMINGKAHHSKGKYKVQGITDSVSSNGFQTTYDLYRINNDEVIYKKPDSEKETLRVYYNGAFHDYNEKDFLYNS